MTSNEKVLWVTHRTKSLSRLLHSAKENVRTGPDREYRYSHYEDAATGEHIIRYVPAASPRSSVAAVNDLDADIAELQLQDAQRR